MQEYDGPVEIITNTEMHTYEINLYCPALITLKNRESNTHSIVLASRVSGHHFGHQTPLTHPPQETQIFFVSNFLKCTF